KLVSVDFNHHPASSSFALDQTKVMEGTFVSVMSWYDNEWGFSSRMADTAVAMGKLLKKLMDFRTLDDIDVKSKRVLVRADLNVPMADGKITDNLRILRQAPTIRELAEKGARVIVLSHFDRPQGKVAPHMSLKPVAEPLAQAIGRPVAFVGECVGIKAEQAVAKLKDGEVLLLENTRFHPEEEKNDRGFAIELAKLGDIFVNDAFSAAHRAHASTVGIAEHLPSAAGRAMGEELRHLEKALSNP